MGYPAGKVKTRWKVGDRMLEQACTNFQTWAADQAAETVDPGDTLGKPTKEAFSTEEKPFWKIDTGGLADRYCQIGIYPGDGETSLQICSIDDFTGVRYGNCPEFGIYMPAYNALSPKTPIAEIAE